MAAKGPRFSWKLENGSELVVGTSEVSADGKNSVFTFLARFDLRKIFPSFTELTQAQRFIAQYGVKQKLSDVTAKEELVTIKQKIDAMKEAWGDLLSGKMFEKKASTRTAFDLGAAVRALRAQGLKDEVIAMALQKPVALVSAVVSE